MYDTIRARLAQTLADRQADGQAAAVALTAAQAAQTAAQTAIAQGRTTLDAATQSLASAQAAVTSATADVQARQAAVDDAQAAVDEWIAEEPDQEQLPGGHGHPSPAYLRRLAQLRAALTTAERALGTAQNELAQAGASVGAASAAVTAAQGSLASGQTQLAAAEAQAATARADAATATAAARDAQDALAALDARIARLAAPFDRADLEAFADEEQVEVAAGRARRASTRADRYAVIVARGGLLADHDAGVEALAALAQAMHGWSNASLPDPPQVAVALDAVVASARTQRAASPRADDLAALTGSVQAALARLQTTVDQATSRRDQAMAALESAIADVQSVNEEAP